ncbi:MAG: radical SAM protein [Candidatus Pacebacteria bacterium]|nr:radical SAM protein [Candidatus Paceibacterota bacterium]
MLYPTYLHLSKKEFQKRIDSLFEILKNCEICPRKCHINRQKGEVGYCGLKVLPTVSSFNPHFGEEKILVGEGGSGTIFFTSCNLRCVYCQNYEISQLKIGEEISFERLAEMMIYLQKIGCHNINLVTPTPQVPAIVKAIFLAKDKGLKIPIVYNTNAYDSVEVLKLLEGIVNIYMPDFKYSDSEIAKRYSDAPNYFEVAKRAIKEMQRQVGDLIIENGIAKRGLLIRHLVLPNNLAGPKKIFEFIANEISKDAYLHIMAQYWPAYRANQFPELSRRITKEEYWQAVKWAKEAGLRRLEVDFI